tara:strand:- start:259 stop:474 length:216 start_codon:yes stop_codon:yes gene_type:complete
MITVYKEITDWGVKAPNTPNHTYFINDKDKLVAYIKSGTTEIITIKTPMSFTRSYRKFKVLAKIKSMNDAS